MNYRRDAVPLIPMPLADILAMFPREAPRIPWWRCGPLHLCNCGPEWGVSDLEIQAQVQLGLVRELPMAPTLAAILPDNAAWWARLGIKW